MFITRRASLKSIAAGIIFALAPLRLAPAMQRTIRPVRDEDDFTDVPETATSASFSGHCVCDVLTGEIKFGEQLIRDEHGRSWHRTSTFGNPYSDWDELDANDGGIVRLSSNTLRGVS